MITLPAVLQKVMDSKNLNGLKPFAVLFRNKWIDPEESGSESGESAGGYVIDTLHPIDISSMVAKPNTLSMTLDVNEVAQYNANNVTLTLSDPENRFLEGTPNSYFPDGYQLYGSRVVLYYGLDNDNKTSIFTGVIKDLPTHKPETYQVDLKLVSPLEMLKDIEAKDFSDKVTGEELHYEHQDDDSHRVYSTAGAGVGGFDAVYADGVKLFEGVDYEVSQTNMLGVSALVTIVNDDYHNADITADYYTWKTGLTVEQIVAGLVGLAGYNSSNTDIRSVVWNNQVRAQRSLTAEMTIGYKDNLNNYTYTGSEFFSGATMSAGTTYYRYSKFPTNFKFDLKISSGLYFLGDFNNDQPYNGIFLEVIPGISPWYIPRYHVGQVANGTTTWLFDDWAYSDFEIKRNNGTLEVLVNGATLQIATSFTSSGSYNESLTAQYNLAGVISSALKNLDTGNELTAEGVYFNYLQKNTNTDVWAALQAEIGNGNAYLASYKTSEDGATWSAFTSTQIGANLGLETEYIQFLIYITDPTSGADITNANVDVLTNELSLQLVNLSGKTVLEALQDFALISGYEFGVSRDGVFFFRPRVQSTTPTYTLGGSEVVKVDTVKRNLNDFFTKLTLTFATVPLEFYANTGDRPTPIDRYGVINKEIDKPEIVNYDNPELAQAIGPQLLEVYSTMPNIIQAQGKLNLALELGDIVSLRRNYPLSADPKASDYNKYTRQDTYYRACKITGMNYNFAKRQITYTLRDVSNSNNAPTPQLYGFVYEFPVRLGVK